MLALRRFVLRVGSFLRPTRSERELARLVTLSPQGAGYDRTQLTALYQELLGRFESLPGVRSATLSATTPIHGAASSRFARVEGFREPPDARRRLSTNAVAPNYFATFGTPMIAGRDFLVADQDRRRVVIVNQAMATHHFAAGDPLGGRVTFDGDDRLYEIVGVVGNAKYADLHDPAPQTVYLHAFQDGNIGSRFALRTDVTPASVAGAAQRAVRDLLPRVKVGNVTTLADQVDASIVPERLIATLSGLFGGLAATLAAVGLYGLLAFTVARRTNEIGVRMTLGATRQDVTTLVMGSALELVGMGLLAGVPIAVWTGTVSARAFNGVPALGPGPILVAAVVMTAVALLASVVPTIRAIRVAPMDALRHD